MTVEVTKKTRGPEPQSMTRAKLCLRVEGMDAAERQALANVLGQPNPIETLDKGEEIARTNFRERMDEIRGHREFAEKFATLSEVPERQKVLAALGA